MLSRRFEQLFDELTSAFVAYHDLPQRPDHVRERATARAVLDRARAEIAEERAVVEQWAQIVERLRMTEASDDDLIALRGRRTNH